MKRTLLASALAAGALLSSGAVAVAAEDDPTCDEARRSVALLDSQVNEAVSADRAVEAAEKVADDLAKARADLVAAIAADNAAGLPADSQKTIDLKALVAELEGKLVAPAELARLRELAEATDANQLIRLRVLAIDEANKVCSDVTTTPPTATPSPTTTVPLPPADDDDDQIDRDRYPRVAPQTGGGPA
jgi:hypothetical protein